MAGHGGLGVRGGWYGEATWEGTWIYPLPRSSSVGNATWIWASSGSTEDRIVLPITEEIWYCGTCGSTQPVQIIFVDYLCVSKLSLRC